MSTQTIRNHTDLAGIFEQHFKRPHTHASFAPGRVEILGNHTDYNEGFVLSAAINMGTFCLIAPAPESECRIFDPNINEEAVFNANTRTASREKPWANYIKGTLDGVLGGNPVDSGFLCMISGNIPRGAGLSSSAALEISTGLAIAALYGIKHDNLSLARIGQRAEHEFAGVKCGLLDQVSSIFGRENMLVMTDFRSMEIANVPFSSDAEFLMCNTGVKHSLVDSEYNSRRASCEQAVGFFADRIDREIRALRDVTWQEWLKHSEGMDPSAASCAAHVIGENTRVLAGRDALETGDLATFGKLMFESHQSSRNYFRNSCPELDFIVDSAAGLGGVHGARLSGGGFGGSVVVLVSPAEAETIAGSLSSAYGRKFGTPCPIEIIKPSQGASLL